MNPINWKHQGWQASGDGFAALVVPRPAGDWFFAVFTDTAASTHGVRYTEELARQAVEWWVEDLLARKPFKPEGET